MQFYGNIGDLFPPITSMFAPNRMNRYGTFREFVEPLLSSPLLSVVPYAHVESVVVDDDGGGGGAAVARGVTVDVLGEKMVYGADKEVVLSAGEARGGEGRRMDLLVKLMNVSSAVLPVGGVFFFISFVNRGLATIVQYYNSRMCHFARHGGQR